MTSPRVIIRTPRGVTGGDADRLRRWLATVEASGIDGVFSGDHVSFHDGTGYDGLIHAPAEPGAGLVTTIRYLYNHLLRCHPVQDRANQTDDE